MEKYTNFIIKRKKILIIVLALISVFAFLGILQIRLNTDFSIFSEAESVYETRLLDLEETFGELNQIVVLVQHDEFNDATLRDMRSIQVQIQNLDHVTFVEGVAPEYIVINNNQVLLDDISANTLENYYNGFGEFSPLIKIDDVYYSSFTVFITTDFNKTDINEIENLLDESSYSSYISGDTYNQLKIGDYILKILLTLPPLTILVIILVFRWQMGAIKPALFSIIPAGVGSLWTFGIIGWIGNEISILTAIVPIFIIVIGSADGLHFMSHFQDSKKEGKDDITSLNETLKIVGVPMIVTTLTSMVGFLSLLSMKTNSVYDLAIFSSVGILLAGVATWFVLSLLLLNGVNILPKKEKPKKDYSLYLKKLIGLPIILIIIIIVVGSAFSFKNINNEFNMLMVYKNYTEVSKNASKIAEVNGGSIPVFITIDLDDTLLTVDSMNRVNSYVEDLNDLDEINKIINPYALFNIVYQNIGTGDIPNDQTLSNIYTLVKSDENSIINNLVSTDSGYLRLLVFPKDLKNDTLSTIEEEAEVFGDNVSVTGIQYLMKDLNDSINKMQLLSIGLALVAVFLMLILTLKSLKIAFYSLLPILITVIALYGFLGISTIPLNITTVIIFSISIGVGIDYAVHFSSVYRHYLKEGFGNNQAVDKAFKNTSRPITSNALGISLGLTVLMASPLTIHLYVSSLMWVSMIVSVVLTLSLLPLLFRTRKQ